MNYSMFSNSIVAGTVKHSNSFSHMRSKSNLFEVIQKVWGYLIYLPQKPNQISFLSGKPYQNFGEGNNNWLAFGSQLAIGAPMEIWE
jgi:hypothetical protein